MEKEFFITTAEEKFIEFLNEHADKNLEKDREKRIIGDYKEKYKISGKSANIKGRKIHIDYLPTIDAMLEAKTKFNNPLEVVGGALYKIEKDECIFLTDANDSNLKQIYEKYKKQSDALAEKLWKLNTEKFDCQWTHLNAIILSGSFSAVFGQSYKDWRKSLS